MLRLSAAGLTPQTRIELQGLVVNAAVVSKPPGSISRKSQQDMRLNCWLDYEQEALNNVGQIRSWSFRSIRRFKVN